MKHLDWKTAAGFLTERADFLYVYHVPSAMRDGWDVVLRVDGTYSDEADAIEAAEGMRQWIESLVDVPKDGRTWWKGPPEWKQVRDDSD